MDGGATGILVVPIHILRDNDQVGLFLQVSQGLMGGIEF